MTQKASIFTKIEAFLFKNQKFLFWVFDHFTPTFTRPK
jgi:hypothetical protein